MLLEMDSMAPCKLRTKIYTIFYTDFNSKIIIEHKSFIKEIKF